jgi:hypothetical protein
MGIGAFMEQTRTRQGNMGQGNVEQGSMALGSADAGGETAAGSAEASVDYGDFREESSRPIRSSLPGGAGKTPEGGVKFQILHFNDFHTRFLPTSTSYGKCETWDDEKGAALEPLDLGCVGWVVSAV